MEVDLSNLSEKARYDYQLVREALENNNQKAYAELMNRYREPLFFMLLKMVNNKDDAEDLTVEAFGKAFKSLDQYTAKFAFSTWLFKIATNNCIDFIRKRKMKTTSLDKPYENDEGSEMSIEIKSSLPSPDEKAIFKQEYQIMLEAIEKLKPRYKELIKLRFFEELSYEEIAERLDLPLGTVKAQLFRAREFVTIIYNKRKGK
jgi:RNA polymerase sigma-70 factor (ECF subfamily)